MFDWKSTAAFGMPPTGVSVIITLSGDYKRIVGPCYYLRDYETGQCSWYKVDGKSLTMIFGQVTAWANYPIPYNEMPFE